MSTRITVTLDDDVIAGLKRESEEKAIPFGKVINDVIRRGLGDSLPFEKRTPFAIKPFDLGERLLDANYDNIGELLEVAEGEFHR